MNGLDEYQQEVLRTTGRSLDAYPECVREAHRTLTADGKALSAERLTRLFDQLIWCLGLAGEVGETLDLLKKSWGHGHPLDLDKLKKELGDVRWYGAALEDSFGFRSSEVAQANADKLRARYPTGFSVEASKAKADVFKTDDAMAWANKQPCCRIQSQTGYFCTRPPKHARDHVSMDKGGFTLDRWFNDDTPAPGVERVTFDPVSQTCSDQQCDCHPCRNAK